MDFPELLKKISDASLPDYWYFDAEDEEENCCEICRRLDGKVFRDDDPAKPQLPLHPHCRCSLRKATEKESLKAMEIITPQKPSFNNQKASGVIEKLKNIYNFKIPKPPRENNNKANWLYMTWMWFFEQGENPIHFSSDSLESQDIANSYSMKTLKDKYFKTGEIPKVWIFTGPETATGNFGEVEWFMGSYSIKDFKLKDGIATFTVYNKSGWRSGTRLPKSWTNAIKELTSFEIAELVTDAPRGEVLKTKFEKYYPEAAKISGMRYILKALPSFGGDWEQYYEIRMEWKK